MDETQVFETELEAQQQTRPQQTGLRVVQADQRTQLQQIST
jgi:hypothetical protein